MTWNPFAAARIALRNLSAKFRPIPVKELKSVQNRQDRWAREDVSSMLNATWDPSLRPPAPTVHFIDSPYCDTPTVDCSDAGGACGD